MVLLLLPFRYSDVSQILAWVIKATSSFPSSSNKIDESSIITNTADYRRAEQREANKLFHVTTSPFTTGPARMRQYNLARQQGKREYWWALLTAEEEVLLMDIGRQRCLKTTPKTLHYILVWLLTSMEDGFSPIDCNFAILFMLHYYNK